MKQINIITLGCSKNTVDSEKLIRQFKEAGYNIVYDRYDTDHDTVIINTCGFINDAKEESINTILQFVEAKRRGKINNLHVMGCLSERYRDDLRIEIPEVDNYFGVNDLKEVVNGLGSRYYDNLSADRVLTGPGHYAYLKISEGCDRDCAFCAIPLIRGRYISSPVEELVEEGRRLAAIGVKELILIAQDLSYYGLDLYKKQMLAPLVEELSAIEGIDWIRLHYLYPANFPMEIINLMKNNPKICRYIDLPIQHISDKILKMMRRSHTGKETRNLLALIRSELPDATIRTTLIAGHPGETKDDYNELVNFIREFRFDRLGVFPYSHEEDTFGFINYKDNVSEKKKKSRTARLMKLQQEISALNNKKLVGKHLKIIIDREEGNYYIGRSEFDSPDVDQEVLIPKAGIDLKPGDFTTVTITGSSEFDLMGEV